MLRIFILFLNFTKMGLLAPKLAFLDQNIYDSKIFRKCVLTCDAIKLIVKKLFNYNLLDRLQFQ